MNEISNLDCFIGESFYLVLKTLRFYDFCLTDCRIKKKKVKLKLFNAILLPLLVAFSSAF